MAERFQQEKASARKVVEDECESKNSFERAYLLQRIEVLKEGLDSLRIQKHELAKILTGKRMPWSSALKERKMNCGSVYVIAKKKLVEVHMNFILNILKGFPK